ncbi:hypothetical protein GCM10009525_74050 [Streptosporangium amethystogenes subsp. fukuiense]
MLDLQGVSCAPSERRGDDARETAEGTSQVKIDAIIGVPRSETYRWTPVRRVYVDKKGGAKKRPLGLTAWSDKLIEEGNKGKVQKMSLARTAPRHRPDAGDCGDGAGHDRRRPGWGTSPDRQAGTGGDHPSDRRAPAPARIPGRES